MQAFPRRAPVWATAALVTATCAAAAAAQTASTHRAHTRDTATTAVVGHVGSAYGTHLGTQRAAVGRTAIATLGCTSNPDTADSDRVASTKLGALGKVGAVTGRTATGATSTDSTARVTGVDLLAGRVTASVVGATATAATRNGAAHTAGETHIAGLTVAGKHVSVPTGATNRKIVVPGAATVLINHQTTRRAGASAARSVTALQLTLTHPLAGLPRGTVLNVGHAVAGVVNSPGGLLHGQADGSRVTVASGTVQSGPTFRQILRCMGTSGEPTTNAGALATQHGVVHAGNVHDSARGNATRGSGQTSSRVTGVNLLNGVIRAKAVQAIARVSGQQAHTSSNGTHVVGLVVSGREVHRLTKPNQHITVPGVGELVVNATSRHGHSIVVHGLDLTLAKRFGKLARGTEITVADARVGRTSR